MVLSRRRWRLQDNTDGHLFSAVAENLRCCLSFTSPTDQFWLRLSAAATFRSMPRIPVGDIGPVYPVLASILPGSLDRTFLAVNIVAGIALLGMVATLVWRATRSVAIGITAIGVLIAGPVQSGLFARATLANFIGDHGYDVLAATLMIAAIVNLADRPAAASRPRVATVFLVLAGLTRLTLVAVPLGFVVLALVSRRRFTAQSSMLLRVGVVASGACLAWQLIAVPLIAGSAPKALGWHRHSWIDLPRSWLGWLGADAIADWSAPASMLVFLAVFGVVLGLVVRRAPLSPSALLGTAAVAITTAIIGGQATLVADIILNDERHHLPARVCLVAFALIEAHALIGHTRLARTGAHMIVGGATALLSVAGSPVMPDPLADRGLAPVIVSALERWPDALVMTNEPTTIFAITGRPALAMLAETEAATDRPLDPSAELSDLAAAMPEGTPLLVVQTSRYPPALWPPDDDCVDVHVDTNDEATGLRIAVVDVGRCATAD